MVCLFLFVSLFVGALCDVKDGGKAPRIPLNDGNSIPAIGLGTFLGFDQNGQKEVPEKTVENAVFWALDAGYRLIDTAALYLDEDQVGKGIRASSVPREDIFVVTKIGSNEKRDVLGALKRSLERLNQTYVDLYLIHFPISFTPDHKSYDIIDYVDTWKSMEEVQKLGLAKSIGVSNFNVSQMNRLIENSQVKPAVLQIEVNLNLAQNEMINYCKEKDIVVMAYTPFGSLFEKEVALATKVNDPILTTIAHKYGKTVPQIALRFLVQKGVVPIPKSVNKPRIEENINIFDFELTEGEMEELRKLNKNYRTVNPTFWQDHPYYPYEKKDVPDKSPFVKTK